MKRPWDDFERHWASRFWTTSKLLGNCSFCIISFSFSCGEFRNDLILNWLSRQVKDAWKNYTNFTSKPASTNKLSSLLECRLYNTATNSQKSTRVLAPTWRLCSRSSLVWKLGPRQSQSALVGMRDKHGWLAQEALSFLSREFSQLTQHELEGYFEHLQTCDCAPKHNSKGEEQL